MEDDTNDENDTTRDNGDSTTVEVGKITGDDGTEESTGRKNGGNQGDFGSGDDKGVLLRLGRIGARNGDTGDSVLEN